MAFGERCEACGRTPVDYNALAPEEARVDSFSYCALCSKDLCPDCFKNPCQEPGMERKAVQHQPYDEDDEW